MSEVSTYNTTHQSFKNRKKYGNLKLMKKIIYKKIKNSFFFLHDSKITMKCKNHSILGWKSDTKQKSPIQSKYFFKAGRYSRHFLIECSKYQDFHRCFQNSLSFLLKKKKMALSSLSSFCLIAMEMGAISFRFVFERAQQFQGADWLSTINMGVNLSIIILIPIDVYRCLCPSCLSI